jgi:hypothetical protein
MGCFLGLGCFSLVVCVWDEGLVHTVNMDAMLSSVGVSVEACWRFYSCVICLVFLSDLNHGFVRSFSKHTIGIKL